MAKKKITAKQQMKKIIDQYRVNPENGCLERYQVEVVVDYLNDETVTISHENEGNDDAGNSELQD